MDRPDQCHKTMRLGKNRRGDGVSITGQLIEVAKEFTNLESSVIFLKFLESQFRIKYILIKKESIRESN